MTKGNDMADELVEREIKDLAHHFWSIHPRAIQDMGITREQFYAQEIRALIARLSRPSTAEAVAVKALEWNEPSSKNNGCFTALSSFGEYYVVNEDGWHAGFEPGRHWDWDGDRILDTEHTAKAAAQAHNDRLIRSALTHPSPQGGAEPGHIAAMARALKDSHDQLTAIIDDGLQTDFRAWRDDINAVLRTHPIGETDGPAGEAGDLIERLRTVSHPISGSLCAEAAASLAAEKLKVAELERSILTFRGEVTDEMVDRACRANIHPDTDPSDVERRKMRRSLEAANVCESCASAVDHWKGKAEALEQRVAALVGALTTVRGHLIDGQGEEDVVLIIDAALATEV